MDGGALHVIGSRTAQVEIAGEVFRQADFLLPDTLPAHWLFTTPALNIASNHTSAIFAIPALVG